MCARRDRAAAEMLGLMIESDQLSKVGQEECIGSDVGDVRHPGLRGAQRDLEGSPVPEAVPHLPAALCGLIHHEADPLVQWTLCSPTIPPLSAGNRRIRIVNSSRLQGNLFRVAGTGVLREASQGRPLEGPELTAGDKQQRGYACGDQPEKKIDLSPIPSVPNSFENCSFTIKEQNQNNSDIGETGDKGDDILSDGLKRAAAPKEPYEGSQNETENSSKPRKEHGQEYGPIIDVQVHRSNVLHKNHEEHIQCKQYPISDHVKIKEGDAGRQFSKGQGSRDIGYP